MPEPWTPDTVPDEHRKAFLRWGQHLRAKHGIDIWEFNGLLGRQRGRCGICRKQHRFEPRGCRLQVDHCHNTDRIRGLLCQKCNTALGKLGDCEGGVMAALAYLRNEPLSSDIKVGLVRKNSHYVMRWEVAGKVRQKSTRTGDRDAAIEMRDAYQKELTKHLTKLPKTEAQSRDAPRDASDAAWRVFWAKPCFRQNQ